MNQSESANLPRPTPELAAHSKRALANILAEIRASGPISFQRYMEMALYAPGLGYYSSGTAKFGAGGDFITAPVLGDLFAQCLARQCAQVLEICGSGDILEFGAGTGDLASGLLRSLDELGYLPEKYRIVEVSADLAERQREQIDSLPPHLGSRVEWLTAPPEDDLKGVVLANEVLDAIPVYRFRLTHNGPQEILVGERGDGLCWESRESKGQLREEIIQLVEKHSLSELTGYESEVLLHADEWVRSMLGGLSKGLALLIDYGYPAAEYYHPQRADGTLICHFQHRSHADPLYLPGGQDITAFVNFTRWAWAASRADLDVAGFTSQAHMLLDLGITDHLDPSNVAQMREVKHLTLPSEMGERFKALALTRNLDFPLQGFQSANRLDRL